MEQRIIGVETEFGCLVQSDRFGNGRGSSERIVEAVKDHAFLSKKLGLLDMHARDYAFEPARSGGFLLNGGRLYVDAVGSHEEYATPECITWTDVVAYDRAGRVILQTLVDELDLSDDVAFYANSVDHFGGHTFGCHENYLVDISASAFRGSLSLLMPFLVTRQIFAGVGRVGGHRLNRSDFRRNIMTIGEHDVDTMWVADFYGVEIDPTVNYQLSQRADHIVNTVSSRVRFNRAIINPKRDSYYDYSDLHRLHVLFGEPNMSEYAMWLKIATTCIVLDLLDLKVVTPEVRLEDPLSTLKEVSRDQSLKWSVRRANGRNMSAIDLQRLYLMAAQTHLKGKDEQTDWALEEWENVLDGLERDPMQMADQLDWVAKRQMLEEYMASEGVGWKDDVLHSLDLEYHNINPRNSLYYGLEEMGAMRRVCTDEQIENCTHTPPQNTRAKGRADVISQLIQRRWGRYLIDWDWVRVDKDRHLELRNPFHTYEAEAEAFTRGLA
ncbi:MAG: proteasome accessory factor PafA2 family protein [Abitibacteriaceae bacterium]|nr:proteasome accessory factor PafA2 family protein [Abditibacteriaceae bacterium]MBV9865105.1 proteasome accessory factor PafA2 family protein [Abditibacteriaceae bacterium]